MSIKNLYNEEARAKIKEMAESIDMCMMSTDIDKKPFHSVVMSTKQVDDEGKIWFLSGKSSEHTKNIEKDGHTYLMYSDPGSFKFLNVFGKAHLHDERAKIKELYVKTDDAWFDGPEDPNIVAIHIVPQDVNYWDPKSNKLVSLAKMVVGAITGEQQETMNEGKLEV